jgi:hypothetical protein
MHMSFSGPESESGGAGSSLWCPAPPLSLSGPEKDMCMRQLLALMEDEEYLLANGRVVIDIVLDG